MKPILLVLSSCLLAGAAWSAETAEEGLKRCRAVGESAARLACYDALLPAAARPAPAAAPPAAPAAPLAAAPSSRAPSPATAPPAPAVPAGEASFGRTSPAAVVQDISSSLPGIFEGWERNTQFRLANGQVWKVIDGSSVSAYLRDPKVVIRRAALGSFRMEIEGLKTAVRVERVD